MILAQADRSNLQTERDAPPRKLYRDYRRREGAERERGKYNAGVENYRIHRHGFC